MSVLTGFTVVLRSFGGPLILKLTPKTPSPVFFPTKIFPTIGILEIVLLKAIEDKILSFAAESFPFRSDTGLLSAKPNFFASLS